LPTADDEPSSPPVSAVNKQAGAIPVARKARIFLRRAACFTCFIRLRSGIANSHQNKPSPTAAADSAQLPCNYGNHMMDRLRPAMAASGAPAASAAM
jgi:hypothetical protein